MKDSERKISKDLQDFIDIFESLTEEEKERLFEEFELSIPAKTV